MDYELPEDQIPIFEANFDKATELAEGLMIIQGKANAKMGYWQRRRAKKAIKCYQACLELIPHHWQSHWLMAKVYQATGDRELALQHFETAVKIEPSNPDLPREASIAAMDLGKVSQAVEYSEEALNRAPVNPGLLCNHAVNLMVMGRDEEALQNIERAMELDPGDEININVHALIKAVASGERRRPRFDELG